MAAKHIMYRPAPAHALGKRHISQLHELGPQTHSEGELERARGRLAADMSGHQVQPSARVSPARRAHTRLLLRIPLLPHQPRVHPIPHTLGKSALRRWWRGRKEGGEVHAGVRGRIKAGSSSAQRPNQPTKGR